MSYEHRIYDTTREIQQIVIGIEQLRCRKHISRRFSPNESTESVYAEQVVRQEILQHIDRYIKVAVNTDEGYVESEVFLPYVYDDVVARLNRETEQMHNQIMDLQKEHVRLMNRSWWQRILNRPTTKGKK